MSDKSVVSEYSGDCDEDVYEDEKVRYVQDVSNVDFVLKSDDEYFEGCESKIEYSKDIRKNTSSEQDKRGITEML